MSNTEFDNFVAALVNSSPTTQVESPTASTKAASYDENSNHEDSNEVDDLLLKAENSLDPETLRELDALAMLDALVMTKQASMQREFSGSFEAQPDEEEDDDGVDQEDPAVALYQSVYNNTLEKTAGLGVPQRGTTKSASADSLYQEAYLQARYDLGV